MTTSQKHRSKEQKTQDRELILKLLRERPRTVAELARLVKQPMHNIDNDLRLLGRRVGKTREGIRNVWHITGSPKPYQKKGSSPVNFQALWDSLPAGSSATIVLVKK